MKEDTFIDVVRVALGGHFNVTSWVFLALVAILGYLILAGISISHQLNGVTKQLKKLNEGGAKREPENRL